MINVGVIGAGAWGSALAIISKKAGNCTSLWSYDGAAGFGFDGQITGLFEDLSDCDVILVATPAANFRETIRKYRPFYKNQSIIICTKGAESDTNCFMSEILAQELPECREIGVLSGPQFAAEAAAGVPTGSTLAGPTNVIKAGRAALPGLYLEESDDILGTQICGVGKNAVALIAGFFSVAAKGENERALKVARAWNEVVDFGTALGATPKTFLGLCGIGDLFLSATSPTSRNFAAGIAIAQNQPITGTVEGISALRGIIARAKAVGTATPILSEMAVVLG
ncbi:MAG: hypothetical protein LBJ18_04650 [Rickettsiales bacterium]|jgi:glycerol-3-phosphate dehydrogenase (NAD(P)+)|nr:hypothetical protein [Rickettsiales bacterium]